MNNTGYVYLAIFEASSFDFSSASQNLQKAEELEPNNPEVFATSSVFKMVGMAERMEILEKAIRINPLDYFLYYNLGLFCYYNGEIEEAKENLNIYALHYPDAAVRHYVNGFIYVNEGQPEAAFEEMQKEKDPYFKKHGTIIALLALGNQQEADSLLEEFISQYPTEATNIAQLYAFKGNRDKAFHWLNVAIASKDPTLIEGLYYPEFKILYNDARWAELVKALGLPKGHGIPLGATS